MKLLSLLRLTRIPAGVAAAVCLIAVTYPGGLSAAVEDFAAYRQNSRQVDAEQARDAELTGKGQYMFERMNAKHAVVCELIGGRITLAQAADRFLALNAGDGVAMEFLRERYDGSTDAERAARNVLDHASGECRRDAAVIARLDRQFRARFGHSR